MKISPKAQEVLTNLRAHTEGSWGDKWHSVYLDNARPTGMSPRSFAGYLATLKKAGLYRSQGDDCFGDVLVD